LTGPVTVSGTPTSLIVISAPARTVRLTDPCVTSESVAPRRYSISGVPTMLPSVTGWMRS
jgi:hypothetical protein